MDFYSRKIVGYAYETKGLILHSDLGSQYTSRLFEAYLEDKRILHSFSRKCNPYDNACIESFHSALKKEEIYLNTYQDFKEAKRAIFEYIESWYNLKRIHSAIDYMTPQQREELATFCQLGITPNAIGLL